jgi:hypothetical protein
MGVPVNGIKITEPIKRGMIQKMNMWIQNRFFSILPIKETIDELGDYAYKKGPTGKYTYMAPSGRHDDIVMSLALAVMELTPVMAKDKQPDEPTPLQNYKQGLLSRLGGDDEYWENLREWQDL